MFTIERSLELKGDNHEASTILATLTVAAALAVSAPASANLLLNGDLENNSAGGTLFNMSNAFFTSTVANATAFGTSNELDLVTSTAFGIAPQSGNWKVGMHQNTGSSSNRDQFSLDLSGPLSTGASYDLSFYGTGLSGSPFGTIEVGVSTSASSFGSLIFSATPTSASVWDLFQTSFVAPIDATHLTFSVSPVANGYAFVDNASLTAADAAVPLPASAVLLGSVMIAAGAYRRMKSHA